NGDRGVGPLSGLLERSQRQGLLARFGQKQVELLSDVKRLTSNRLMRLDPFGRVCRMVDEPLGNLVCCRHSSPLSSLVVVVLVARVVLVVASIRRSFAPIRRWKPFAS